MPKTLLMVIPYRRNSQPKERFFSMLIRMEIMLSNMAGFDFSLSTDFSVSSEGLVQY